MNNEPNSQTAHAAHHPRAQNRDQSVDDVALFKRKRVIVPLLLLFIAAACGSGYWYMKRHLAISTDDAFVDADRMTLSSKVLGRIERLRADEGDTVRTGDTLALLDDADLRAQLSKVNASIRSQTQNREISLVNAAKALDDFSRAEKQFAGKIITQEQYNHAQNALKLAQAQADMAAAQIENARADAAILKIQMGNMTLRAPFDGAVAKRWALAGEIVQPGQAVFSLYNRKSVFVTANFEETKLPKIRLGQQVSVSVDAIAEITFPGKVESIGRSTASLYSLIPANNASGNFTKITQRVPIKISLDSKGRTDLLPGLSAFASIDLR